MLQVVTRDQIGLVAPNGTRLRSGTDEAFIHHAVITRPRTLDEAFATWRMIQRQHMGDGPAGGKTDIAYSWGAWSNGTVRYLLEGRGWERVGGATYAGGDFRSVSLCVLDNLDVHEPQDDDVATMIDWYLIARDKFGNIPARSHREVYATACPGQFMVETVSAMSAFFTYMYKPTDAQGDDMPSAQEVAEVVWNTPLGERGSPARAVLSEMQAGQDALRDQVAAIQAGLAGMRDVIASAELDGTMPTAADIATALLDAIRRL